MGSRSNSKSSSNSTYNTGGGYGVGGVKGANQQASMMNGAAQHQQNLMGSILGTAMPAFGELIKGGMEQMNSNPMYQAMGAMMGMPIQTETPDWIQGFIDKHTPTEPAGPAPVVQPDNGWGGVKTNSDAIAWSLANGDITPEEADWLNRWSNDGGMKGDTFTNDNWMNWDHNKSDLTGQNKAIVSKFKNSLSGNYGQPAQQQPAQQTTPQAANMGMMGRGNGRRGFFGGAAF